ncbi:MAG TPA: VanW family protein, partial [Acidothermaceae bacterium]|nr:VanW family protein [Acidothermaceae bacterium]
HLLRIGLITGGSLVALAAIGYGIAYAIVGSGVLPNTTVSGPGLDDVAVGRMSPAAATAKVEAAIGPRASAPMTLTVSGQAFALDPTTSGLTVDPASAVAARGHRDPTPAGLWKALFAHPKLNLVVSVDNAKLDAAVTALNSKIVGGGHDGSIEFHGTTPVAIAPVTGLAIEHDQAVAAIKAAYLTSTAPVALPVETVQPSVTAAAVQTALTTIAQPAVASPIALVLGTNTVQLSPAVIAANLTFQPSGGALLPVLNSQGIEDAVGATAFASLQTPSKDASFDVSSGTPVLIPSVEGGTADLSKLGAAVSAVLTKPAPRTITVPAKGVDPAFTTADAQKLGVKEMVSTFTTHYPCCASRVTNIHTIAKIVNGAIVMPGATFSLNKFVGPRDTKRGFVLAPMIEDGLFEDSVGGGISQFATTLYNAVFFAGIKDITHQPHSYYISRYPAGREATVSYPEPNLIFQNNEPTAIVITTSYTGTSLTVTFWGTKYYDVTSTASARYAPTTTGTVYNPRPDCEASAGEGGFQIDITQTLSHNGVVAKVNHIHTKYQPEPIIICGPSPSPSPGGSGPPGGTPSAGAPTGTPSVTPSKTPSAKPSSKPSH